MNNNLSPEHLEQAGIESVPSDNVANKVPLALQKDGFAFVKLKPRTKIPLEHDWQNKPYSHSDIQQWINQGGNYGVQGGYGGLIIIDADSPEIDEIVKKDFPETFTVRTPKQGHHYYYLCEGIDKKIVLNKNTANKNKEHLGEIIAKGSQVVGAGSIHPDTGTKYELINDVEIATISRELVYSAFMEYIPFEYSQKDAETEISDISVVEVLSKAGIQLRKVGSQLVCSQPVHGSTNNNNLVVDSEKNVWHCFRCNTGGGALSLIAILAGIIDCREAVPGALRGDKFTQALKAAKEKYGFDVKVTDFNSLPSELIPTFEQRISEATPENYKPLVREIAKENDVIKREFLCKSLAKQIGVSLSTVQQAIKPLRNNEQDEKKIILEDTAPWEEPVKGGEMLDTLYSIIQKHVVLEPPAIVATTLWTVETYCYDSFDVLPMIGITSPEKRCGKTTLLGLLSGLVDRPLPASNISPPAIYRTVEKNRPCLLIDEADTFLKDNPELRGIINSGHTRKTAFVIRCNPNTFEPERFFTWCPKAISLIGTLSGTLSTLSDRAIPIKMRRKLTSEKVKRITQAFDEEHQNLRRMIKRWVNDNAEILKNFTPVIPEVGNDRASDNWLPLLSIAELAGYEWPDRARRAMLAIESVSNEETTKQILLRDIKEIFDGRDKISSAELVEKLIEIKEHPWADLKRGKPITQNSLATLLKPFEIFSKKIRSGNDTFRGYALDQFTDAFERYLPSTPPFQSGTMEQTASVKGLREFQNGTQTENVPLAKQRKPASINNCASVPLQKGDGGQKALSWTPGHGGNKEKEKNKQRGLFEHKNKPSSPIETSGGFGQGKNNEIDLTAVPFELEETCDTRS